MRNSILLVSSLYVCSKTRYDCKQRVVLLNWPLITTCGQGRLLLQDFWPRTVPRSLFQAHVRPNEGASPDRARAGAMLPTYTLSNGADATVSRLEISAKSSCPLAKADQRCTDFARPRHRDTPGYRQQVFDDHTGRCRDPRSQIYRGIGPRVLQAQRRSGPGSAKLGESAAAKASRTGSHGAFPHCSNRSLCGPGPIARGDYARRRTRAADDDAVVVL